MSFELPDPDKCWEYENGFYLTCDNSRISKILSHYDLYKKTMELPGEILEFGVFKGASLARFAAFRDLFGGSRSRKIIAFDTFSSFPETEYEPDKPIRQRYIDDAGDQSISRSNMESVLRKKKSDDNIVLVEGDITKTLPEYIKNNPQLKISMLNLDVDIYEPAKVILELCWDKLVTGGILILDDYGTFAGETKAVDEFFKASVKIEKMPYAMTPSFIVK
jgi:hypothetical protein